MPYSDRKVYRSFEEFEREELRTMETVGASVDDMIDSLYGEGLDFEPGTGRRSSWTDDADDEE